MIPTQLANQDQPNIEAVERLLKLPPVDRYEIAHLLLDSIDDVAAVERQIREETRAEIACRLDRLDRGEERTFTLEEVMADLRAQAEARRS